MKLTHVDEMPCLEHNELIYLTEEQLKSLSTMNAEQTKAFLRREVMQGLSQKEKGILTCWLDDRSIDWDLTIE